MEVCWVTVYENFTELSVRVFWSLVFGQGSRQRMENIRDLVYEGWTSKTSKKGKGGGKGQGRSVNQEDAAEEDRIWGKDSVRLR